MDQTFQANANLEQLSGFLQPIKKVVKVAKLNIEDNKSFFKLYSPDSDLANELSCTWNEIHR